MKSSMNKNRSLASKAQVDLIPMIDVVFQLILFFLVSTTFAVMPAITLKLPESSTSENASIQSMTITVAGDNSIFFNEEPVSIVELDAKLSAYDVPSEERSIFPVRFEADELVTNGTIVKIFDALRKNGFANVNLRTMEASN